MNGKATAKYYMTIMWLAGHKSYFPLEILFPFFAVMPLVCNTNSNSYAKEIMKLNQLFIVVVKKQEKNYFLICWRVNENTIFRLLIYYKLPDSRLSSKLFLCTTSEHPANFYATEK